MNHHRRLATLIFCFFCLFIHPSPVAAQDVEVAGEPGFVETVDQMAANGLRATAEVAGNLTEQAKEVAEAMKPDIKVMLSDLLGHLRSGGEFIGEQTPLLFEDIILWGIFSRLPWVLIAMVMLGFGFHLRRWSLAYEFDPHREGRGAALAGWVYLYSVSAIIFALNLSSLLKPLVAPRLYLIEELIRLAS